jgi:hypothetical protein
MTGIENGAMSAVMRRAKRGAAVKSGTSRNAQWAIPFDINID